MERVDPDGPNGVKVRRFHNEDDVINVGKDGDQIGWILVREEWFNILNEIINGHAQVRAEDRRGETFTLKNALYDL